MGGHRGIQKDSVFIDEKIFRQLVAESEYRNLQNLAEAIGWHRKTLYRSAINGRLTKLLFDTINEVVDLSPCVINISDSESSS